MPFSGKNNITSGRILEEPDCPLKMTCLKDLPTDLGKDPVRGAPQFRFNIGKDRVTQLNGFKFLKLFQRNLVGGFKTPPCIQQGAELFQMSIEAFLSVVARGLGGDQELPVRGFKQQQFTA